MNSITDKPGESAASENEEHLDLLGQVAAGDKAALSRLYLLYHARLFKFVFRLTRSYSIADEVVNDIMLVVWQKAGSFRGESRVSTWIFGIAYRQAMRRITRNGLRLAPLSAAVDATDDSVCDPDIENWVEQGLNALPAAQQLTVVLVFYLGLTYEETARMTDCPVNTVKTRMFHARRKLKEYLTRAATPVQPSGEPGDE